MNTTVISDPDLRICNYSQADKHIIK